MGNEIIKALPAMPDRACGVDFGPARRQCSRTCFAGHDVRPTFEKNKNGHTVFHKICVTLGRVSEKNENEDGDEKPKPTSTWYGPHLDLVMSENISFVKQEGSVLADVPVSELIELVLQSDRIVELRTADGLSHIICFFHQQDCSQFLKLVPQDIRRTRAVKRQGRPVN